MYLIDQRSMDKLETLTDSPKRKEDWKKSAFNRSKTCLSHEMKRILEDDLDEDVKAKQYRQVLSRFLNTQKKKKQDESPVLLQPPPLTPPPPSLSPVSIAKPESKKKKNYKAKRSSAQVKYYSPPRRSKRAKKWQNL